MSRHFKQHCRLSVCQVIPELPDAQEGCAAPFWQNVHHDRKQDGEGGRGRRRQQQQVSHARVNASVAQEMPGTATVEQHILFVKDPLEWF